MRYAATVVLCALVAFPGAALAHQSQLSSSRLTLEGTGARALLEVNGADLDAAAGVAITGEGGAVLPERLAAQADAVLRYVGGRVRLGFAGGPDCARSAGAPRARREHVLIELAFRCAPTGQAREYGVTLFHDVDAATRHVVTVEGSQRRFALLGVGNARLSLAPAAGGLAETLWHYLLAGIEHIAIGYDHIAFLLAVIVPGGGFWSLFAAVTAFTVSHSITLSLAVLGVVAPPVGAIEALIAASIVYTAAENFVVRDLRRRWRLTFVFGLVHGFGFAAALREYGMPGDLVAPALAAFNLGVELGQLAIVAAALVLWRGALAAGGASAPLERRAMLGISAAVLALGLYWLGQRLLR